MSRIYRQYDLRSDDHRLTCWLEVDHRVRVGTLLTLKEDSEDRHWEVLRVSQMEVTAPPEKRWRVGGLL